MFARIFVRLTDKEKSNSKYIDIGVVRQTAIVRNSKSHVNKKIMQWKHKLMWLVMHELKRPMFLLILINFDTQMKVKFWK